MPKKTKTKKTASKAKEAASINNLKGVIIENREIDRHCVEIAKITGKR